MASNLTRYDPFGDVMRLNPYRDIEDLVREFSVAPARRGPEPERRIRVDVRETDQAYMVKADMPGLKKEYINISVDGNLVSISGTMREPKEQMAGNAMYTERYSGSQYRSFTLPQELDDAKTEARYEDGVLHVTLPKKPGTARKQIMVQ